MSRGAWIPILTLSPAIPSTEISTSSPIMIDWLVFLVSTSIRQLSVSRSGSGSGGDSGHPEAAGGNAGLAQQPASADTLGARAVQQELSIVATRAGDQRRCAERHVPSDGSFEV